MHNKHNAATIWWWPLCGNSNFTQTIFSGTLFFLNCFQGGRYVCSWVHREREERSLKSSNEAPHRTLSNSHWCPELLAMLNKNYRKGNFFERKAVISRSLSQDPLKFTRILCLFRCKLLLKLNTLFKVKCSPNAYGLCGLQELSAVKYSRVRQILTLGISGRPEFRRKQCAMRLSPNRNYSILSNSSSSRNIRSFGPKCLIFFTFLIWIFERVKFEDRPESRGSRKPSARTIFGSLKFWDVC